MTSRPDSPCIAMCSTGLGDDVCCGCGRTFIEVANWATLDADAREVVWQRLERFWQEQGQTPPWRR